MPSRNVVKSDISESYYHVYGRGASKQAIFRDRFDSSFFLGLLDRYLSLKPRCRNDGIAYPHYRGKLEILAYCLMGNHFHLLIYQQQKQAMSDFMRSIMTSYTVYFNRRYGRTGALLESKYKASRISSDSYLQHISRYIHLNPRYWKQYQYSSLRYYLEFTPPEWLEPRRLKALFESSTDYLIFLEDYIDQKAMLEEIKHELADH